MMFPKDENFFFPAEWHPHESTWLSWPVNTETWDGKFPALYDSYTRFIKEIAKNETVNINCGRAKNEIMDILYKYDVKLENIKLHDFVSNDSWCRDHGPAFLINKYSTERIVVDWEYNAWGGKYPPYNDDNALPNQIAQYLNLPSVKPGIIMEGGSVEFNGKGSILTSKICLNNKNRNPHLNQEQIENFLFNYYGAEQVLWVEEGIVGDDTDGHIDDTVRWVNEHTVITMVEPNKTDENHTLLKENLNLLKKMRLPNQKQLDIIEIEMPSPVYERGERLPASYANFYICNTGVIVPTYRSTKDEVALSILEKAFKDRPIIGIDSTDIIWGLGSFHCLSQQEPKPNI